MKTFVKYLAVILPIVIAGFYFIKAPSDKDFKEIVGKEMTLESKGYSSVSIIPVNTGNIGQQLPPSESKMEIEVSSEEILTADAQGLIGSGNDPFSARYITEEDVKASIERIIIEESMTLEEFDEEYLQYIINLRHLEMTDGINELNSQVKEVAIEYKNKILKNK